MRGLLVDPQRLLRLANSGTGRTLDAQLRPVFPSCVSLGLFRVRESYRTLDAGRCFVVVGLFVAAHVVLVVSEALLSAESFSALETLERPEIRVLVVQVTAVGDFRGEHGVALVADHPGAALGLDRGLARDSRLELFDVVLLVLGGVRVDGRDHVPLLVVPLVDPHLVLVVEPLGADAAHEREGRRVCQCMKLRKARIR